MSATLTPTTSPPPGGYYGGHGPEIVAVSWALFTIATVLIGLRIYTRFVIFKSAGGWSLFWACVAWCLGFPSSIFYTLAALYGLGNHIGIVMFAPKLSDALLFEWIAANTISYSVFFGKLSALLYILEIQDRTNKMGKWILISTVALNGIMYIVTTPMIFTQCYPSAKLWDQQLPGNCNGINRALIWAYITGAWGTFADFLLALYPVIIIWNLRIRKQLKLIISFLMGLGVVTAVCSLVKTVQFKRLATEEDATYAIAPLMILGMTEMWVVLIASSAAPLWPLFRGRFRATTKSQNTGYGSSATGDHSGYHQKRWGYKKAQGTGPDQREMYNLDIAAGKLGGRPESQEAIMPGNAITLTHNISISHENSKGAMV
ncbi:hypothetical protein B0O99DRAFT_693511 [Bisporella sp. PMI_857]|nr:hypothetical protein B0O99DRAFT_693511 [Bisporella sp. PMI_857]